jgi:predicted secreted hydrolase
MNKRWIWLMLLILCFCGAGLFVIRPEKKASVQAELQPLIAPVGEFERVTGPIDLKFPLDYGQHPDYLTEWWYYTGNLDSENGRRYGYQLTFFRRALQGRDLRIERESNWGTEQIYLAHFTLTDADSNRFYAFERLERGAAGLAGTKVEPELVVWLHDWKVEQIGLNQYRLTAAQDNLHLELEMQDLKGVALQGDRGYSRKGPETGNASIYFSQPRLETKGTLEIDGQQMSVKGLSWMDHEFSTSALSDNQIGWDWFSIQFDDGRELMVYRIRRDDDSLDPFSQGILIETDGRTRRLSSDDFHISVEDTWRSPHSGGVYPAEWTITIPGEELKLRIRPVIANQELGLSYIYWEGAVDVEGEHKGQLISGRGYVELTGYAQSLKGRF